MITMRSIVILLIFFPALSFSQTLVKEMKSKNFGVYQGEISSYHYLLDTVTVQVEASPIEISIDKTNIDITIGRINKKGSYHILFKGKDYYVIDAFFEGDVLTERILLNEKNKTMVREGSYPQPNTTLRKTKKK